MKLISYSLFNHPTTRPFEKVAYIRNFFFNFRMNRLIYPDWITHLEISDDILLEYRELFEWMAERQLSISITVSNPPLCEGMIRRMRPCFKENVSHVLCRDADSLTTYREAIRVQHWLESGKGIHSLHDNPAHGGLMGGMTGFNTAKLKAYMGWNNSEEMISGFDLSERGSDQHLLNQIILPKMQQEVLTHDKHSRFQNEILPNVDRKFAESDLCIFFIGAAGVNELETIRFFKRVDEYNWEAERIQAQFKNLFYWI